MEGCLWECLEGCLWWETVWGLSGGINLFTAARNFVSRYFQFGKIVSRYFWVQSRLAQKYSVTVFLADIKICPERMCHGISSSGVTVSYYTIRGKHFLSYFLIYFLGIFGIFIFWELE